ncbi:GIY-YIG nuclease family protein [Marinobacter adhaerens]|uniref:GIY-YIG nuclease family protein n=1 Tax=Marinobacter adhaerens TaxID=1033846 RepID=A0A851HU64_9GAMM|nr:GIY-YIG nuclease family protein [Marinobacter adhaerens]NWN92280.1 GIY-YIG nuclease family protein [Marinobacter adhaerens]
MQSLERLEFLRLAQKSAAKSKGPEPSLCKLPGCREPALPGMVVCDKHKLDASRRFYAQIGLDPLFHMRHAVNTFPEWCWTYFVGSREHGIVKIGKTECLKNRMRDLRNSSPVPVKLFAVVFGDHDIEPFLHDQFKASRKHGEWFEISDDINECIEGIKAQRFARHIPESMIPTIEERVNRAVTEMAASVLIHEETEGFLNRIPVDRLRDK